MKPSQFRNTVEFEIERNNGQHLILVTATVVELGHGEFEIEDLDWEASDWDGKDVSSEYNDHEVADMVQDQLEMDARDSA